MFLHPLINPKGIESIIHYNNFSVSTAAAATTTNSSLLNSTQIQSYAQKIPAPSSNLFQEILNYVADGYNWLVSLIQNVLQSTLLKQDPELANTYANIIAWLVPLTAIYIANFYRSS
ncbi:hypothetical protein [Sulfuracidifex tepidarius]|nr:hypothetical protein [Sulfuracidifex tepidarius]